MTILRRARPLLGTLVEIVVDDGDHPCIACAIDEGFAAVAEVQALMSFHDPASELSHLNREAWRRPVSVSRHTWNVLQAAQELARRSDGLFDVTTASTLCRRGFLPRHERVPEAAADADWRAVELLPRHRVRFTLPLQIDLGGIAKGYAVDCAVLALQRHGVRSGRVDAGGDGRDFGRQAQTLHVRHPARPTTLVPLLRWAGAVATSAAYFSRRRRQGRSITPLIQPHSGQSCDGNRSVTVLAAECMSADALTKVIHADPVRGAALLAHYGARALVLEAQPGSDACRLFDSATTHRAPGRTPAPERAHG